MGIRNLGRATYIIVHQKKAGDAPSMRRRPAAVLAAFAVVALALAPAVADARAGGRGSSGSRGSQTYTAPPSTQTAPGTTRNFDRTDTAPARPGAPAATAPGATRPATAATGGFLSRNPVMAGLMGGLLGAGLFGLLSGAGLFGGLAGFAGFLGLLLQVAIIAGLVFLVMRLIRGNRQPALAGGPTGHAREMQGGGRPNLGGGNLGGGMSMGARPAAAGGPGGVARRPIEITATDFQTFERSLMEVQDAWSRQDLATLRRLSTPEMERYFAQDLKDLAARGWTNVASDVRLESGDLAEAWQENGQDYATVAMRFSLVETTTDATGKVVEGHPTERETATEVWTFTRRQGTPWLLSAIQQAG
jgi:predicted lipid-binding transport protein (Tim44 family)